ncbi:MAG: hypothetical protein ACLUEK_15870, partial [Oscillospiraceae bacterium]
CYPVSNGVYHLMLTSIGLSSAFAGGVSVYRGPESPLEGPAGMRIYLETPSGEVDLLPLPGAAGGLKFTHALRGGALSFEGRSGDFRTLCSAAVSARDMCEVRFVEINAERALEGRLCLIRAHAREAARLGGQRAYWRLGMPPCARALLIRCLPRGGGECWLCLKPTAARIPRDRLGGASAALALRAASAPVSAPLSGGCSGALPWGPRRTGLTWPPARCRGGTCRHVRPAPRGRHGGDLASAVNILRRWCSALRRAAPRGVGALAFRRRACIAPRWKTRPAPRRAGPSAGTTSVCAS